MPLLMYPAPSGKEGLAIDLGQLASHSLPLGSPSLARWSYAKLHLHHRESREYGGFSFLRTKIVCVDDGLVEELKPSPPFPLGRG